MNFQNKLSAIIEKNNSLLCIGLDPDLEKFPSSLPKTAQSIFSFNKAIIDTTHDLVCAYKPNIAFYEAYGFEGLEKLKETMVYLQEIHPDIPIVLDAKRGDIGNTARMYAKAVYEFWNADATTVYPNLGKEALLPFLEYKDKLTIALIKTSNPDSGLFQNIPINGKPYYQVMAETIKSWGFENLGVFVGATYPEELGNIRKLFPNTPILTAGIGAQDGNTEQAVKAGIDARGGNFMCNNSREVIYAGNGNDFAAQARAKAETIRDTINQYR